MQVARDRLGLTQTDLARRIKSAQRQRIKDPKQSHISQTTISDWERGVGSPTVEQLAELAKALGLSVAELVGENTAAAPPVEAA